MALTLTLKVNESVYVDNKRIKVVEVFSKSQCLVEADGKVFQLVNDRMVEIFPDVFVSLGLRGSLSLDSVCILIEAPKEKLILRESLMRKVG
jgi:sRNA-binding carbon storage regulator CsrA